MADSKISDLNALTTIAPEDAFPVVDNDVAETKKIAWSNLTKDEDDMSSDSNSHWPTQQSVKAYVDGQAINSGVRCKAELSSDQSVSSGTWTKLELATEIYDTGSDFDSTTNYRFTAPVAGYYLVAFEVTVRNPSDGKRIWGACHKNGSVEGSLVERISAGSGVNLISVNGAGVLSLSVDDYIDLRVYHDEGTALNFAASYLTIHLLST